MRDFKRILVLGAGISGIWAARLARNRYPESSVILADEASGERFDKIADELLHYGIICRFGCVPEISSYADVDLIVLSPGIAPNGKSGGFAASHPAEKVGELAFAASHCDVPMLAVTGTNGKTTTVELLQHFLSEGGFSSIACGNIGMPLSRVVLEQNERKYDWLVVEVSSFQLESADGFSPAGAALMNITPDHLARHGSMEEYSRLKYSLLSRVKKGGLACVNASLATHVPPLAEGTTLTTFSAYGEMADLCYTDGKLAGTIDENQMNLYGRHNMENTLAAMALARFAGVSEDTIRQALTTFHVDAHRLEFVECVNGIDFIDDSKGTNVDALIKALQAVGEKKSAEKKKIVLISGGIDKGCDLSSAKNELMIYVKYAVLIGECRERLAKAWMPFVETQLCDTMEEAVKVAAAKAEPGDCVLLSPGCASQDMFRDYAHRGNVFQQAARTLPKSFCAGV